MEVDGDSNISVTQDAEQQSPAEEDTATDAKGFPGRLLSGHKKKPSKTNSEDVRDNNSERIPRYRMNYPSSLERGYAVIINNENFHWMTGMNQRKGTDADERNLSRLFNRLDFRVVSHRDKTRSEMMEIASDVAKKDHSSFDCFIMTFLSHGDDGVIYGTDGTLEIKKIVDLFTGKMCPSLAGKPKVFIFQACRGDKHEEPIEPAGDVVDGAFDQDIVDAGVKPTIPNASDFLFCYSVTEGFYSHRDTLYGSWFIQAFVEVFEEELINRGPDAAMQHDILDLLTLVNHKVSRRSVERTRSAAALGKKQMPCFVSMLTKKLYLARKKC